MAKIILCFSCFLVLILNNPVLAEYRPMPGSDGMSVFWVQVANSESDAMAKCISFVDSKGYDGEFQCAMPGFMDRGWPEDGLGYIAAGWLFDLKPSVLAFFLYEPKCQRPTKYNRDTGKCEIRCPENKPWDNRARACLPEPEPAPGACPNSIAGNPSIFLAAIRCRKSWSLRVLEKSL